MIGLLILIALCYYGAYYYWKKRKFYRDNGREVEGQVMFFEKRRGWKGQRNWPYYMIKVSAEGREYLVETDNSKARKYAKQSNITLLVPRDLENPLTAGDLARFDAMAQTPEEKSQVSQLYAKSQEMDRELDYANTQMRTNLAIIKEDLPGTAGIWFLLIFGTLLAGGTVVSLILEFV